MSYEEMAGALFALMCRAPQERPPLPGGEFRGQFVILRCLRQAGGQMFAGDLASALQLTTGRIATAIKRLDAMGLVEKRKTDADGRRTAVRLTDAGQEALRRREAELCAVLTRHLSRLTEAEAAEYVRLNQKMAGAPERTGNTQEELC